MPSNDDDTAAAGGGGSFAKMIRWEWNYRLMVFGVSFRNIYFWLGVIALAGTGWLR